LLRGVGGHVNDGANGAVTHSVEFFHRGPRIDWSSRRRLNAYDKGLRILAPPHQDNGFTSGETKNRQDSGVYRHLTNPFVDNQNATGAGEGNGDGLSQEHVDDRRCVILAT